MANKDAKPQDASLGPRLQESESNTLQPLNEQAEQEQEGMGIPPTQRMSQVCWSFCFLLFFRSELTTYSSMALVSSIEPNISRDWRTSWPGNKSRRNYPTGSTACPNPDYTFTAVINLRGHMYLVKSPLDISLRVSLRATISMLTPAKSHNISFIK